MVILFVDYTCFISEPSLGEKGGSMVVFDKLKSQIINCKDCKEKFGFEPNPIIFGNSKSKIMQISQAPSMNVHKTRRPFNDQSGKKLIHDWYKIDEEMFYNENNFYITALSHCYPGRNSGGTDRLPPIHCARKWLLKELEVVENEIFVIIGSKAAKFLFGDIDFSELVFNDQILNGKPTYILPHPSPLNIKWFKDNPAFYNERLFKIQNIVRSVLGIV